MKYRINRRSMRHGSGALLALLLPPAFNAMAQEYPTKAVRIVVPFSAGGSTDVLSRMIAQKLTERFKQNVLVDNRPGATGTIAGAMVAKSDADGATLMMHSTSSYTAGFLYSRLPYDAATAFAPVLRCAISGLYLTSNASLPAKNLKELIALARRRPGELSYGTVGKGSAAHLATEMFNSAAGIKTIAVPYKGAAPTLVAQISGEVGFSVLNILDPQPFVKQGKLRALAVTSAKRSPALPDVPTMLESGVKVEAYLWTGLFSVHGTPAPIINKLNAETTRILEAPDTKSWLINSMGAEFSPHTPQQFADFLRSDTKIWKKTIDEIGLKLN